MTDTALTVNCPEQPVAEVAATPFREPPGNACEPLADPMTMATDMGPVGAVLPANAAAEQIPDVSTNGLVPTKDAALSQPLHVHVNTWPANPRHCVASGGHKKLGVGLVLAVRVGDTASADTALTVKPPDGLLMADEVMPLELPPG